MGRCACFLGVSSHQRPGSPSQLLQHCQSLPISSSHAGWNIPWVALGIAYFCFWKRNLRGLLLHSSKLPTPTMLLFPESSLLHEVATFHAFTSLTRTQSSSLCTAVSPGNVMRMGGQVHSQANSLSSCLLFRQWTSNLTFGTITHNHKF